MKVHAPWWFLAPLLSLSIELKRKPKQAAWSFLADLLAGWLELEDDNTPILFLATHEVNKSGEMCGGNLGGCINAKHKDAPA